MASAKQDFERFVAWLHLPATQTPPEVKRFANLVLANFDGVVETVRQRSQRSSYLVPLARRDLALMPDSPPAIHTVAGNDEYPWNRLRNITLGPFRGFRRPELFDLQKGIILFYGPNGSGKTSFCEGLEFALLGSIEEAESKRIDARLYLANLHEGRFEPPILKATDRGNREVSVAPNADAFRFCFIEKNRIDAFSRIAARPPAQRTELIATLFGMDKFNDFVDHFNESIDQQLVLTATKQLDLTRKRSALANDRATVDGQAEVLLSLVKEETALASTYSKGMTYEGLKALIGTPVAPGRLHQLETILNALPPTVIGLSREGLMNAFDTLHRGQVNFKVISGKLDARSSQVAFKDLYSAVLALQSTEGDHCPACDTPLAEVKANPFDKATDGLAQLKELGELQEERNSAQRVVTNASRELRQQLLSLGDFLAAHGESETPVGRCLADLPAELMEGWLAGVYHARAPQESSAISTAVTLEHFLAVADRVAAQDEATQLAIRERQRNISERDRLNAFQLSVQAQELKRQQADEAIAAAKGRIKAFDLENAALILEAAQEARDIERDIPIKSAYDGFLRLLKSYRNQLPGTLMAGLNDAAMNLYNDFNINDLEQDKLAAIHLPLTSEEKIEITFRGNSEVRVDALRILSEGHIRCLGLAILLAKNQSIQTPLIVFDDAINAIDHEHREGIRTTIFESGHFAGIQLIVTCHSDEFIKDVQNHLPAQRRGDCLVYLFRNHTGDHQPRVSGDLPSRNYVEKARASIALLNSRESLASCRQGLEMLSEKVWRWLVSHEQGLLTVQLRRAGSEPDLYALCTALRRRLKDATTFHHANKPALITAYERVLGIPVEDMVWNYLNKGTHEEANRDDFDANKVEKVVQTLEELDGLDLRAGH